jgi:hypothetical protein
MNNVCKSILASIMSYLVAGMSKVDEKRIRDATTTTKFESVI